MKLVVTEMQQEDRRLVLQRLTALWAFTESGLGGILHAFKIPFTGLVVGGMAVLLIVLIAHFAVGKYKQIIQSMLIVLLVKAIVSPHTPFPAYIAVSFQGLLGYSLFKLIKLNAISITVLAIAAMLESAIQKLLVLIFFFGQSAVDAADALVAFAAKQLGIVATNGSAWIIGVYLSIYLIGGLVTAVIAFKMWRRMAFIQALLPNLVIQNINENLTASNKANQPKKRKWKVYLILLFLIAAVLWLIAPNAQAGWIAVLKSISWTITTLVIWYAVISPLVTRFLLQYLLKKEYRHQQEINQIMATLPVMQKIAAAAWTYSGTKKGWSRLPLFFHSFITWALLYTDQPNTVKS